MPSAQALRALAIIRDRKPISPRMFAEYLWPIEDPRYAANWTRSHNCGQNGSTSGAPMWRAGGSFLSRLDRAGLIIYCRDRSGYGFTIALTIDGEEALAGAVVEKERLT